MMPHYYSNESPTIPSSAKWSAAGGTMNAAIVLDQPGNVAFTNLDEISGHVVVRNTKPVDINSVVVKLEGESRSRLMSPAGPNGDKPRPQLEYHKILYRIAVVFPPDEVMQSRGYSNYGKSAYTLPPGQHEYPFNFKIPFNNSCSASQAGMPKIGMSQAGLEIAKPPSQHVKKILPPTLSGYPGEAEIRYFVKATVARHSPFRENPRAYVPFNFFPIEPPRPPATGNEVFARQKHSFGRIDGESGKKSMKAMLGLEKRTGEASASSQLPSISIEARLPEPAILTCNTAVPLRLLLKRLTSFPELLLLDSLQVALIGNTKIRAHDVYRVETNSWILVSKSNIGTRIGTGDEPPQSEIVLDNSLWSGIELAPTVAPSFETCNIQRSYQLDVKIGLQIASNSKPQMVVLPMRLDVEVFSGIAPPADLLDRLRNARFDHQIRRTSASKPPDGMISESKPSDPANPTSPTFDTVPQLPPRPGVVAEHLDGYDDAPPSYEDAIATQLPPVDGPRPNYQPPPPAEDDVLRSDEKKGWV